MTWKTALESKINDALAPSVLRITDDSTAHAGHYDNTCNTLPSHLKMLVVSTVFEGLSPIARQRRMHAIIADEISAIHAVSFKLLTPEELELRLSAFEENRSKI